MEEADPSQQQTIDDVLDLQGAGSDIFCQRSLLNIDNIPDEDRIVGRDEYIMPLARNLKNFRLDGMAKNVFHWGETGTGKTLVARHVSERLEALSTDNEDSIVSAYLSVDPTSTYTRTFKNIASQVNAKANNPISIPPTGVPADYYRQECLWPLMETEFPGGLIVIIDEMDKHPDINEVLYTLSRTQSKDGIDVPVVTIGISNDITFKGDISGRVESSLQPEHKTFTPYNEEQLIKILENRRDAFYENVLRDDVIPTVASLAAKEHGDARRAVDLLMSAGEVAEEHGDTEVTVEHVQQAENKVETDLFIQFISGTGLDAKLLLFAIVRLQQNHPDKNWFRTSEIHTTYETIAADVQTDKKSYNRAMELLNNHVTTGVLESKKKKGGDQGKFRSFSLQGDAKTAKQALIKSTPTLQDLMSV